MTMEPHVLRATFAKSLKPGQDPGQTAPVQAGLARFEQADKTIFLSVEMNQLPTDGTLSYSVLLREDPQQQQTVLDFSTIPEDARKKPSVFLGLSWKPKFPLISRQYTMRVSYHPKGANTPTMLGTYPFEIAAPADAISSKITSVALAAGETPNHDPIAAPAQFRPDQPVYLVMRGDLGKGSFLGIQWDRGGEGMSQAIPLQQNQKGAAFSVYFLPQAGWTPGSHKVSVFLNDGQVWNGSFVVKQ